MADKCKHCGSAFVQQEFGGVFCFACGGKTSVREDTPDVVSVIPANLRGK